MNPEDYITAQVVKLEPPYNNENATLYITNKDNEYAAIGIEEFSKDLDLRQLQDEEYETIQSSKKKRGDDVINKLKRDDYFKLDHNSYNFKDTLGDWDDRLVTASVNTVSI